MATDTHASSASGKCCQIKGVVDGQWLRWLGPTCAAAASAFLGVAAGHGCSLHSPAAASKPNTLAPACCFTLWPLFVTEMVCMMPTVLGKQEQHTACFLSGGGLTFDEFGTEHMLHGHRHAVSEAPLPDVRV
eukprot:GHRQ01021148.1.p4 GENE.GHRQ01021148.1~~GHRQ01021148.1.p4  ORF type:complete len:132 (-),score=33.44 GHRQ01021148.1:76-471(-)